MGGRLSLCILGAATLCNTSNLTIGGALRLLTIIKRTMTKPTLAAMSMAPNTESKRMLRSETSFYSRLQHDDEDQA